MTSVQALIQASRWASMASGAMTAGSRGRLRKLHEKFGQGGVGVGGIDEHLQGDVFLERRIQHVIDEGVGQFFVRAIAQDADKLDLAEGCAGRRDVDTGWRRASVGGVEYVGGRAGGVAHDERAVAGAGGADREALEVGFAPAAGDEDAVVAQRLPIV